MLNTKAAPFLRSIAEDGDTNTGRLVFADWLEEQGDAARAEFIRVQCELSTPKLAKKRRQSLLERERDLLDAHRDRWCQEVGLPIEDVHFERGLIARARLSQFDGDRILDPESAPGLATLAELDLSSIKLSDGDLGAFAKSTRLPGLTKLILSNNDITNTGVKALASASGLPALDTVYLFGNKKVKEGAHAALEEAKHFKLANLDTGERDDGYCMSPGQAEMGRRDFVRTQLLPIVRQHFDKYPRLRSAMLCVAQYWNDEANDAVHGQLMVSELFEPDMAGADNVGEGEVDPNIPNSRIPPKWGDRPTSLISLWDQAPWDDNYGAIPLWAAFAPEGAHQEMGFVEAYAPAVRFYRHGGYMFEALLRPQLDGVQPEEEAFED